MHIDSERSDVKLPPRDFEQDNGAKPEPTFLDKALALAARGYRVFPLQVGGKRPVIDGWPKRASFDPQEVRAMWVDVDPVLEIERVHSYNIGIATGRTRDGFVIVVDVDCKDGAKGFETLAGLELLSAEPLHLEETERVETASGGLHLYYDSQVPLANTASKLGPNIDTRGEGGYVVGPGSSVGDKLYAARGDFRQTLPAAWVDVIGAAPLATERVAEPACELDTLGNIERATRYLQEDAPIAIEGHGGNDTTFRVAMRVKDQGISEDQCWELMLTHWNDRCLPDWSAEELRQVVANAYAYGKNAPGSASPERHDPDTDFDEYVPPAGEAAQQNQQPEHRVAGFDFSITAEDLMKMDFPAVRWVAAGGLPEGLTVFAGPPKVGKSWFVMELATEVAAGGRMLGQYACERGSVLMLALEDNLRRLKSRFLRMNAHTPPNLAIQCTWPRLDQGGIAKLETWLQATPDARLITIDTGTKVKAPNNKNKNAYEHDSEALKELHRLALKYRVAILWVTHLTKRGGQDDDWLGRITGSMGISGVADTIAVLTRSRGQSRGTLNITGRDVSEIEVPLDFDDTRGRWTVADVDEFEALAEETPPDQRKILHALRTAGAEGMSLNDLATAVDKAKTNTANMLSRLKSRQLVTSPKRGWWMLAA